MRSMDDLMKNIQGSFVSKEYVDKLPQLLEERKRRLDELTKNDPRLDPSRLAQFVLLSNPWETQIDTLKPSSEPSVVGHSQVQSLSEPTPVESQEQQQVQQKEQQPCSETLVLDI